MRIGLIFTLFIMATSALADTDHSLLFVDFINGIDRSRIFKTDKSVEVVKEYDSKYECENFTFGARWNAQQNQCEMSSEKFAEVMLREDGKFDVYLSDSNGCMADIELIDAGKNKLVSSVDDPKLVITISSKNQIIVEDRGLSRSVCGGSADFAGVYSK